VTARAQDRSADFCDRILVINNNHTCHSHSSSAQCAESLISFIQRD
jgi:hypothetical protein